MDPKKIVNIGGVIIIFIIILIVVIDSYADKQRTVKTEFNQTLLDIENTMNSRLREKAIECLKVTGGDPKCDRENLAKDFQNNPKLYNWYVSKSYSKIDSAEWINFTNRSLEPYTNRYGKRVHPIIMVSCNWHNTKTVVSWFTFLGTKKHEVRHRFDTLRSKKETWKLSNNNEMTIPSYKLGFANKILNHKRLLLQTEPYGENAVTIEFDIRGLKHGFSLHPNNCPRT